MHAFLTFCQWLDATALGKAMRGTEPQYTYLFPVIEALHILGVALLVMSTSILALRMLGIAFCEDRVSKLSRQFLPWAWAGFGVQLVTGLFLFAAEAVKCYHNSAFWIKMALIVAASVNILIFYETIYRRVTAWDEARFAPIAARVYAVCSILLWFAITGVGRWLNSSIQNYLG
jgi:hypothetical protein